MVKTLPFLSFEKSHARSDARSQSLKSQINYRDRSAAVNFSKTR